MKFILTIFLIYFTTTLNAQIDENKFLFKDSFILITKGYSITVKNLYDEKIYFNLKKDTLEPKFQDCYFIPFSNNILIVTIFGDCSIWNWKQNKKLSYLKLQSGSSDHGFSEGVNGITFSKSGNYFSIYYNANQADFYDVRSSNLKDTIKPISFFSDYITTFSNIFFDIKDKSILIQKMYQNPNDTIYKYDDKSKKIISKLCLKNGSDLVSYNATRNEIYNSTKNIIEIYDASTFKLKYSFFSNKIHTRVKFDFQFYNNFFLYYDYNDFCYLTEYKKNKVILLKRQKKYYDLQRDLSQDEKFYIKLPLYKLYEFGNEIILQSLTSLHKQITLKINDSFKLKKYFNILPLELKNYILSNTNCLNHIPLKKYIEKVQITSSNNLIMVYNDNRQIKNNENLLISVYRLIDNKYEKVYQVN